MLGEASDERTRTVRRDNGDGMSAQEDRCNTGSPMSWNGTNVQPDTREGQAGRHRVAERPVVPWKPGNAGGGKGPQLKA